VATISPRNARRRRCDCVNRDRREVEHRVGGDAPRCSLRFARVCTRRASRIDPCKARGAQRHERVEVAAETGANMEDESVNARSVRNFILESLETYVVRESLLAAIPIRTQRGEEGRAEQLGECAPANRPPERRRSISLTSRRRAARHIVAGLLV